MRGVHSSKFASIVVNPVKQFDGRISILLGNGKFQVSLRLDAAAHSQNPPRFRNASYR